MPHFIKTVSQCALVLITAIPSGGTLLANEPQPNRLVADDEQQQRNVDRSTLLKNDFSDEAVGPYTDDSFKADTDWGTVRWVHYYDRAEVVDDGGNKRLRLKFPKGKFGHRETGGNAAVDIGKHSEVYQRMTVRFEPGFSFVKTGKIVGVGSDAKWSGGNVPREGQGFTSRFVWVRHNMAAMYLYHMDQKGKYGDVLPLGFKFQTGVDYTLTQRVKANTGADKNGILQVWASESGGPQKLVIDKNDIRFGTKGRGTTELMFIAPFHGGGDASYAAQETSHMTLDDFVVSTTRFEDLP